MRTATAKPGKASSRTRREGSRLDSIGEPPEWKMGRRRSFFRLSVLSGCARAPPPVKCAVSRTGAAVFSAARLWFVRSVCLGLGSHVGGVDAGDRDRLLHRVAAE